MKHGDDLHAVGVWPVEHAVREAGHDRLADVAQHGSVHQRVRADPVEDLLHSGHEIDAQPRPLPLLVIKRLVELGLGLVAKDDG